MYICMYVCVYIYIHKYIYTLTYISLCIYMYTHTDRQMCSLYFARILTHSCEKTTHPAHTHTHTHTHKHVRPEIPNEPDIHPT